MNFLHFKDSISQQLPLGFYHFSRGYVIRTSSNEVLLKKVIHQDFHRVVSKICKIIIFSGKFGMPVIILENLYLN